ncbi:hypothetical protein [Roseovarius halotolerans]|uniref:hypothetical protein n=1 Tax=Roseovarius halotolerans TaxID=505353 RepID=UPI00111C231B|nr:hypothetical protein [Roseovarius halotolerans]
MSKLLNTSMMLVMTATSISAQSVEMMIPDCRKAHSYCEAYIEGAGHVMMANCQVGGDAGLAIGWFPSRAAGRQAYLDWAADNRSKWNAPFFSGVAQALAEAFPCSLQR